MNFLAPETKKRFLYRLIILLLPLIALSCQSGNKSGVPVAGTKAPVFSVEDINGNTIDINNYKGKVVLLEFWATWCPPCRRSIPEMETLYEKFADRDFVLIAVSIDEGSNALEAVKNFVDEFNMTYPVVIDTGEISKKYQITSIPTIFLIDKSQKIVKRYMGYTPGLGEELSRQIEALL
ncbi:MAG: TlpA family protein disulfide reductase [Nitrospirae bacterium]|nr:TlpA family protein disulfide reductase [Nitrospirota bacterium]